MKLLLVLSRCFKNIIYGIRFKNELEEITYTVPFRH